MGITFARPPVSEVVIGYAFVPRADVLVPHIGEFWTTRLKSDYPAVQHAVPVASGATLPFVDPLTGAPLPRTQFVSEDGRRMVQLQQDRLYANWRRVAPDDEYVRYPAIRDEFFKVAKAFDEYVTSATNEPLKPVKFELTYVNIVGQTDMSGASLDIGNVVRDVKWFDKDRFLPHPTKFGVRYEFELPNDFGSLGIAIDPARSKKDDSAVYRLQFAAVGEVEVAARSTFDEWLTVAHDTIVRGFKDLTTSEMHERWGLQAE